MAVVRFVPPSAVPAELTYPWLSRAVYIDPPPELRQRLVATGRAMIFAPLAGGSVLPYHPDPEERLDAPVVGASIGHPRPLPVGAARAAFLEGTEVAERPMSRGEFRVVVSLEGAPEGVLYDRLAAAAIAGGLTTVWQPYPRGLVDRIYLCSAAAELAVTQVRREGITYPTPEQMPTFPRHASLSQRVAIMAGWLLAGADRAEADELDARLRARAVECGEDFVAVPMPLGVHAEPAPEEAPEVVVVTRHLALVEYLRETGVIPADAQVVAHVESPEQIAGRHVIGVLPMHLAVHAAQVTEVPMQLTPADREAMQRGDLTLERVRQVAGAPRTYRVQQ